MPFRDAGYSQADFILNIQDVVYGVWKAKEENLCQLKEFNLEEYVVFSWSFIIYWIANVSTDTNDMKE